MRNLKKERREYMKQRQRLRMQGHDVTMCKNVINKYPEGFAFTTTDNQKEDNSTEDIALAITMLQRRIKNISNNMYEAREDMLTRELKQAQRQHDFSNVHRSSRRFSGKRTGPQITVFGRAHAKILGVEEWETAVAETGQEGGQQALNIDFEEQKKLWEEHSALGLLPATEELIKQVDEDLEAFRAKVKKKNKKTCSATMLNANRIDTNTSAAKLQNKKKKRCTC